MRSLTGLMVLCTTWAVQESPVTRTFDDGTKKFALAYAKQMADFSSVSRQPDPFMVGFMTGRAQSLAPHVRSKRAASQLSLSATLLGMYDEGVKTTILALTERVYESTTEGEGLSSGELKALNRTFERVRSLAMKTTRAGIHAPRQYAAGMSLGKLAGKLIAWQFSGGSHELMSEILQSVEAVAAHGEKSAALAMDLSAALGRFVEIGRRSLDEEMAATLAQLVGSALRASLPEKYRWNSG